MISVTRILSWPLFLLKAEHCLHRLKGREAHFTQVCSTHTKTRQLYSSAFLLLEKKKNSLHELVDELSNKYHWLQYILYDFDQTYFLFILYESILNVVFLLTPLYLLTWKKLPNQITLSWLQGCLNFELRAFGHWPRLDHSDGSLPFHRWTNG